MSKLKNGNEYMADLDAVRDYYDQLYGTVSEMGYEYPYAADHISETQDTIAAIDEIRAILREALGNSMRHVLDMLMEVDVKEYIEMYKRHKEEQSMTTANKLLSGFPDPDVLRKEARAKFLNRQHFLCNTAAFNYVMSSGAADESQSLN